MGRGASTTTPYIYLPLDRPIHPSPPFHTLSTGGSVVADPKHQNPRGGVWERVRALIRPRRAPHPSIAQVMAQWVEYELIFNDILQRLNAQLARQAKMEKQALARLVAEGGTGDEGHGSDGNAPVPILSAKAALRSRVAQEKFGGRVQAILEAKESRNVDSGTGG